MELEGDQLMDNLSCPHCNGPMIQHRIFRQCQVCGLAEMDESAVDTLRATAELVAAGGMAPQPMSLAHCAVKVLAPAVLELLDMEGK